METLPLLFLALCVQSADFSNDPAVPMLQAPYPEVLEFNSTIYGTCEVTPVPGLPSSQPQIFGQVLFRQDFPNGTLEVKINLRGLPSDDHQVRAIHVHQYGDLSQGCVTAGPHYNPRQVAHPAHPGDLGNFQSQDGLIRRFMKLPQATLFGGQSVLGRAVVVHEKEDDLGKGPDEESKRSGNAGKRIAGCVIGITTPRLWWETQRLPGEELEEEKESRR